MKPYDSAATCPKCGNGFVSTVHHEKASIVSFKPCFHANGEHLDRECARCRFSWFELPLDRAPSALHQEGEA